MGMELHGMAALLYLGAGLLGALAWTWPSPRAGRVAVWVLGAGAVAHGVAFLSLHAMTPPPSLTDLPAAISVTAWVGVVFSLWLGRRGRLGGLVVLVGPAAFLGAFVAALRLGGPTAGGPVMGGSWPHAHVLLASAGLALLGVAGIAGLLFLVEHRALKTKRRLGGVPRMPSLEALDRVNVLALTLGFPLLTLGVVTGMLWLQGMSGRLWTGTPHQTWTLVAWLVYAALAAARFGRGQRGRDAALYAIAGFALLLFAVVGIGWLA